MYFDLPLDELQVYRPDRHEPHDFEDFWQKTMQEANEFPLDARYETVDYGLRQLKTLDVTFNGYGGQPVKGWLVMPNNASKPLPCVVSYIGYGGGRSFPTDWLMWACAGYAEFVMDTRGQGSAWSAGETPDQAVEGSSSHYPGFMTLGVLDPKTYYYRRLYVDALRAVEAARSIPEIDAQRIAVHGSSQGGGISLAVSGLIQDLSAVLADVPFLCHFDRAVTITDEMPYKEIQQYCKIHRDQVASVFQTLSYFDGMQFAARANSKALFSVALMDPICPPSTVFAAYNHYAGPKRICVYHFNNHDGGGSHHDLEKIRFLHELWG